MENPYCFFTRQSVFVFNNYADLYRLWVWMANYGDVNLVVWIHGFRTNKQEFSLVTWNDYDGNGSR